MKRIRHTLRQAVLSLTGKALVLCGVAAALSACLVKYGCPMPDNGPDYWTDQAPEPKTLIKMKESENHLRYEQTATISTKDCSADAR